MQCLICKNQMYFFFKKKFDSYGLNDVEYWQCQGCGFALSKTHRELTSKKWEQLNYSYHSAHQGKGTCSDDPKWIDRLHTQATVLSDLVQIGLIHNSSTWLDFACGDGKLSNILKERYNLDLLKYDHYMGKYQDYLKDDALVKRSFGFVINTSVFEHFTKREDFNRVESLVSEYGVLGIHTMVCEDVPRNPLWFYLLPVHSAFHTNKSMSILFRQWNYTASIYNTDAQLWLWFKTDPDRVESIINKANLRPDAPTYVFKRDFVDYWKTLPYRNHESNQSKKHTSYLSPP